MKDISNGTAIYWLRRDLRLHDNHALYQALRSELPVIPIFIFDRNILEELPRDDARVTFIHHTLNTLKQDLSKHGSDLKVYYGDPIEIYKEILSAYQVKVIYSNRDYEPYALTRDKKVRRLIEAEGGAYYDYKDHVITDRREILSNSDKPYTVFTPYKKKWLARLEEHGIQQYPSEQKLDHLAKLDRQPIITLDEMGFTRSSMSIPELTVAQGVIKNYDKTRDYPGIDNGTSRLGIHFRFGTISIREKALKAQQLNATFLSELIWRDFYSQIIYNFPHVVDSAFRDKYDTISWRTDESDLQAWKDGQTGYPMVDAGMRELNATGHMHNRVRMVTASFLTKHLLINWRMGEAYFAEKLLDFDLSSNNGGWQWASGSGTDAAPYFRIFNPTSQLHKFDKELIYVKKWIPEYGTDAYPEPIVDHKYARQRCLDTYKAALNS